MSSISYSVFRDLGVDYYEVEERIQKRIDVIERVNRELYNIALGESRYHLFDTLENLGMLSSQLQNYAIRFYHFIKVNSYNYGIEERFKSDLAAFLYTYYFVKVSALKGLVTHAREVLEFIKSNDFMLTRSPSKILKDLFTIKKFSLIASEIRSWLKKINLIRVYRLKDHNYGIRVFDENFAGLNPLTTRIVYNVLINYAGDGEQGARVGVYGGIGTGKTTYSFYSMYGAFRFMGIDPGLAVEASHALIVNDPIELLGLAKYVTDNEDLRLPGLIADDVAVIISKYWTMSGRAVRKAAIAFIKTMKISREKFGVLIFPSDVGESIPKGIRESIDIEIHGDTSELMRPASCTLWVGIHPVPEARGKNILSKQELRAYKSARLISSVIGVVMPPLYVPDKIYNELEENKLRLRSKELSESIKALVEGKKKKKSRASEEIEEEELESM